jgi:hypothetical protein
MNNLRLASLLLPTFLLAAYVSLCLYRLNHEPTVTVPINGYDPVDLLYGHYLQITFDPQLFNEQTTRRAASDYCVCLKNIPSKPNGQNVKATFASCADRTTHDCDFWTSDAGFFSKPQRVYIDERYATRLDELLRGIPSQRLGIEGKDGEPQSRFTADLVISSSGDVRIKTLKIDGEDWKSVVRR